MSNEYKIILILLVLLVILFLLWRRSSRRLQKLHFAKRSLSSRYGKMTEQFMPFLADYPYDPSNFRFLGTPIDGIQFSEDKIIFIEFKAADSSLTNRQQLVKQLVNEKKIAFQEFRIN